MKTIAQQLNVKKFPFRINDSKGNEIYSENSNGFWVKKEFDYNNNNRTYYEDSDGCWNKYKYDSNGNEIYQETSKGVWIKREYDSNGNEIYYEHSDGIIIDKKSKPVELTLDEIANKLNIDVNLLKIKK